RIASTRAENGFWDCSARSAPSSARASRRTAVSRFAVNDAMATRAATPMEIDDAKRSSRRRAARVSRHAIARTKRVLITGYGVWGMGYPAERLRRHEGEARSGRAGREPDR